MLSLLSFYSVVIPRVHMHVEDTRYILTRVRVLLEVRACVLTVFHVLSSKACNVIKK